MSHTAPSAPIPLLVEVPRASPDFPTPNASGTDHLSGVSSLDRRNSGYEYDDDDDTESPQLRSAVLQLRRYQRRRSSRTSATKTSTLQEPSRSASVAIQGIVTDQRPWKEPHAPDHDSDSEITLEGHVYSTAGVVAVSNTVVASTATLSSGSFVAPRRAARDAVDFEFDISLLPTMDSLSQQCSATHHSKLVLSSQSMLPLSIVLDRILTYCRFHSIGCHFPHADSIAQIECRSLLIQSTQPPVATTTGTFHHPETMLHFVVHLWRHASAGKPDDIIVEVQRLCGCPIAMQSIRRALFRVLLDDPTATHTPGQRDGSNRLRLSNGLLHKVTEARHADSSSTSVTVSSASSVASLVDDVTRCVELLSSTCTDHHRLALQSLCCLLDPHSTHLYHAHALAVALLADQRNESGIDNATSDLLRQALHRILSAGQSMDDVTDEASPPSVQRFELHCMALKVVCNALKILVGLHNDSERTPAAVSPTLLHVTQAWQACGWFWRSVVESCHTEIAHAADRACMASVSIRVLLGMVQWVNLLPCDNVVGDESSRAAMNAWRHAIVTPLRSPCFVADLIQANEIGTLDHYGLEQASTELMEVLL